MEKDLVFSIRTWVVILLMMPLVVTNGTLFPFVVGKALFARAIIEIIFGLWVILAFKYPSYRPRKSWLIAAFAIYLGVSLLSGVTGVSLTRSLWSTYGRMQGIVDLTHWFLLILVLPLVFRSMREWRFLFNFNVGVSLVVAILGVAQHYDIRLIPLFEFLRAGPRVEITLGNATFVGAYMLVNVFIALALLAYSFRVGQGERERAVTWWRMYYGAAIGLGLWTLILSGTRGAYIGLIAGVVAVLVGYLLLGRSRRLKIALLATLGILVVVPLALAFVARTTVMDLPASSNVLVQRIAESGLSEGSVRNRIACVSTGVEGFLARPVLGWGPENFVAVFGRYFDGDSAVTGICDHAHNKPIEELATRGILGFLSYSAIWAVMFLVLICALRRQNTGERLFTLLIAAALIGYFVQNLFLFDTPATLLQMVLLMAFVTSLEMARRSHLAEAPAFAVHESPVEEAPERVGATIRRLVIPEWARRLPGIRIFGPRWRMASVVAVVICLVVSAVYFLNYRPYRAATAVSGVIDSSITWGQRLDRFEQSIDLFQPLANYPRLVMFTVLASNWTFLPQAEADRALAMVEREAVRAAAAEPQGWRIYAAIARFYQSVSVIEDEPYMAMAKSYSEAARELAPQTYLVSRVTALQEVLEEDPAAAAADPWQSASAVLVVPVFLLVGADEIDFVWPQALATPTEDRP